MRDRIRTLEECAFNAWPARESVMCDGWVFRASDGYTKRANSANAVAPNGVFPDVQAAAEAFYAERGQPVIFRLTPLTLTPPTPTPLPPTPLPPTPLPPTPLPPTPLPPTDVDLLLDASGYASLDPSIVMVAPLDEFGAADDPGADMLSEKPGAVTIESTLTSDWRAGFSDAARMAPEMRPLHDQILVAIAPTTAFATISAPGGHAPRGRAPDAPVGYGLAVSENGKVGLFDIVVMDTARGRGFGRALTIALLQWGRAVGAREAYLQVVAQNTVARALYTSLGFTEAYRYHYRFKSGPT